MNIMGNSSRVLLKISISNVKKPYVDKSWSIDISKRDLIISNPRQFILNGRDSLNMFGLNDFYTNKVDTNI